MEPSPPPLRDVVAPPPARRWPIATGLRDAFAAGYDARALRADVLSGLVVGVVALPLSMALSIAVGMPPQHGLYTAIVAGASIALLGGCRFQVSGPTAAFIVVLAPITARFGAAGLLTAGLLAGIILIGMGLARLGRLIQFIPYPVTNGFTTGIGVVIATLQLKDALGLTVVNQGEHFHQKVLALWAARGSFRPTELVVAAGALALALAAPRITKRVPAPLLALVGASLGTVLAARLAPGLVFDTIGSRFQTVVDGVLVQGIPRSLPTPALPWSGAGFDMDAIRALVPSAFAIAVLGAIESLLSGVIADGMTRTDHDPDAELVGQGVGNVLAPLFGGIAATGALARTATNIRAGGRSPIAAVVHALVVLLSIVALAPLVAYVPMAGLAALLLLVAWNMSELPHFVSTLRIAPKSDIAVLLTCFFLTVVFDMVVAIGVGVVLAALLFMRRMSELTGGSLLTAEAHGSLPLELPAGVAVYRVSGPLFFGAAKNAMGAMQAITQDRPRALIIDLSSCPVIDATGLVALDGAIGTVIHGRTSVVLAGPLPEPAGIFERARLTEKYASLRIAPSLTEAIRVAEGLEAPPSRKASLLPPAR